MTVENRGAEGVARAARKNAARIEEARAVIEAVKVLDRYGFTTVARLAVQAGAAIANGDVDYAPQLDKASK